MKKTLISLNFNGRRQYFLFLFWSKRASKGTLLFPLLVSFPARFPRFFSFFFASDDSFFLFFLSDDEERKAKEMKAFCSFNQRSRAGASFSFLSFSFLSADLMRADLFYEERSGRGRVLVRENLSFFGER